MRRISCLKSLWNRHKAVCTHLLLWLGLISYVLFGSAIIFLVEGVANHSTAPNNVLTASETSEEQPLTSWNAQTSIRFFYGIVSTTGTHGVIPESMAGMVLAFMLGTLGIPLTFLILADVGSFLLDGIVISIHKFIDFLRFHHCYKLWHHRLGSGKRFTGLHQNASFSSALRNSIEARVQEEKMERTKLTVQILLIFLHIALTVSLPFFQDSRNLMERILKSFFLVTSIGYGDIHPCPNSVCPHIFLLQLIYSTFGIILMTMAIDAGSSAYRQIHHLGCKLKDINLININFGGTKRTIGDILRLISERYEIPFEELSDMIRLTAEGKDWRTEKALLMEDITRIFGVNQLPYADSSSRSVEPPEI